MSQPADSETIAEAIDAGADVSPSCSETACSREWREYEVYGISVATRMPLALPVKSNRSRQPTDPAVTLFLAPRERFSEVPAAARNGDAWCTSSRCSDGSNYLRWRDLFEFLISPDGRSVACRPLERPSFETLQTYLLGQVLSFALLKQGIEPLHATAIVVDGKAIALLGESSFGKSTLAAACLRAGATLLTDDVLVIRRHCGELCGFPGPARLKLFPEIARRFLPQQAR